MSADEISPDRAPAGDGPVDVGEAFESTLRRVARASVEGGQSPATVLLSGESGSGKSAAARRLHDQSPRANGPFVVAHLAGLSPSLIEAELFGHVVGAFTGAQGSRRGRFERASGGTIVLEAIETLAFPLQVKLLRVLQERVVEPVGAEDSVAVDVRVVATTSRDLRAAALDGSFRDDLYYRLAVVPLHVPPLRTRGEAALRAAAQRMVETSAARLGVPPRALTAGALAALAAHPWPGNYRELENAVERVLVLGEGPIEAEDLAFLAASLKGAADEIAARVLASGVGLDDLDLAVLDAALDEERGNASAAARRVGLSRRAFDYRRRKLQS